MAESSSNNSGLVDTLRAARCFDQGLGQESRPRDPRLGGERRVARVAREVVAVVEEDPLEAAAARGRNDAEQIHPGEAPAHPDEMGFRRDHGA